MSTELVKGCDDCPFHWADMYEPVEDCKAGGSPDRVSYRDRNKGWRADDCPLVNGPILVTLEAQP